MKTLIVFAFVCLVAAHHSRAEVIQLNWVLLKTETQTPLSFTQGLQLNNKHWYISSGGYGQSFVAKVPQDNSDGIITRKLPPNWFAEGLSLFQGKLYLLSWKRQQGLVLDADTLKPLRKFSYRGEGWGLTSNGRELIMSNGSNRLSFYQAEPFKLLRHITVHSSPQLKPAEGTLAPVARHQGRRWQQLNELEFFKGLIWANIWQQNSVIAIDPNSGEVRYQLDLSTLVPEQFQHHRNNVLNGLAWDEQRQALWLSGKFWPQRFLIKLPSLD